MTDEPAQPTLNIRLPDEMFGGVWANYAQVSHTAFEFTLDFVRLDLAQGDGEAIPGVVVARVNVSPLFVSQLLETLQGNWERYAERAMPQEVRDAGQEPEDG